MTDRANSLADQPDEMTGLPIAAFDEVESVGGGRVARGLTVILRTRACPIGCSMCDLHHGMLDRTPPAGAITAQVRHAISNSPHRDFIKLYNGGNFFDVASIPLSDYDSIADAVGSFGRVIVENHPRVGLSRHGRFVRRLQRPIEIAIGVEGVMPGLLRRIGKGVTRDDIDRYVSRIHRGGGTTRAFLILGSPGATVTESMRWAMLSVRHAAAIGMRHVSIVPARPETARPEMARPETARPETGQPRRSVPSADPWPGWPGRLPRFTADELVVFASRCKRDLFRRGGRTVVTVDPWDRDGDEAAMMRQSNGDQFHLID